MEPREGGLIGRVYLNSRRRTRPAALPATRRPTRFPTEPRRTALASPSRRDSLYSKERVLLMDTHIPHLRIMARMVKATSPVSAHPAQATRRAAASPARRSPRS